MNICVFGASSEAIGKNYLDSAFELGGAIALRGDTLVFGGGKYGIMGASVRGASARGGASIGVTPEFFTEMNVIYEGCTELIFTTTMRERKAIMEDKADAFIICPGGIGTFEEFFEVLTLKQLMRHEKPIIVYNMFGYYDSMLAMLEHAEQTDFISGDCSRLFDLARTQDEVFSLLDDYKPFLYNKYQFLDKEK